MSDEDQFQDIAKIHTTYQEGEANEAIGLGWRLLRVVTKRDDQEYAQYILGWPRDAGEIQNPKTHYPGL